MATTKDRHYVELDINSAKAARALRSIDGRLKKVQKSTSSLQQSFIRLNAGLGILVGANIFGGMIKDAVRMVDSYNEISGRMRQVVDDTEPG